MKTLSLISVAMLFMAIAGVAQDPVKERLETVKHFVHDLRGDLTNAGVFKRYLRSAGEFSSEKNTAAANSWTDFVRNFLKASLADDIIIYKYSDRPERGRKLKTIDDPDSDNIEYAPLEFELRTGDNKVNGINTEDIYVIGIRDEKLFVLFDHTGKMISCFGLKWGQKVELTEF